MSHTVDVAVGVLLKTDQAHPRILIGRRPRHAVLSDYWEFPGGKLEPNESLRDCLRREFLEEVGLHVRVADPLPCIEHRYDHATVRLHPFFCHWQGGDPVPLAVTECRWVCLTELATYHFPPANASLIHQVTQALAPLTDQTHP